MGKDDIGIVRNGQWFLDMNGNGRWNGTGAGNDFLASFGSASDTPLAGKWRPVDTPLLTPAPAGATVVSGLRFPPRRKRSRPASWRSRRAPTRPVRRSSRRRTVFADL
ncbi:MAG: hypothetical protein U0903_05035 [Planctomycetales bacterium]